MTLLHIEDFGITADRGFLTPYDMETVFLPPTFDPIVKAAQSLPALLHSGHVRNFLDELPQINMMTHLPGMSDAQRRLMMVNYSFLVQAYVWGEQTPAKVLPRNLAISYCDLAKATGQFPILPYASYTLDNWAKIDRHGSVSLNNIRVLQNFLGGQDENWFILVHVEIEAKAGKALAAIPTLLQGIDNKDTDQIAMQLQSIQDAWRQINSVFDRMPERCDPYIYYNRVRPYIHGWKGNPALPDGLLYEGVESFGGMPQQFRGQTGSQSSIVPTMDALFGIDHKKDPLKEYLDELHQYRPPRHRDFIDAVRERSRLRSFVKKRNNSQLTTLYNGCVEKIQAFRTRHLEYAASYINKQARNEDGNPIDIGTGGTPFMKYLKKHRDESNDHLLPLKKDKKTSK